MRVLVTGAAGQLGSEVVAELERRAALRRRGPGIDVIAADRARLDVADRDAVLAAITTIEPHVVIHAGAWTATDACEADPDRAYAVNSLGTRHVAEGARRVGAHCLYISTDYVFDGTKDGPYLEWDATNPLSVYGRSKLGGESELDPGSTVVRTAWVCGRRGANMVKTVLRLAAGDGPLRFVDDQRGTPTVASDLAAAVADLSLARLPGTYHVTNQGATTWFGLARHILEVAGYDPARVEPITTADIVPERACPRPANSVLDNAALRLSGRPLLDDWRPAIARLVARLTAEPGH